MPPAFCGDALSSIEVHEGCKSGFINVKNPDEGFYKLQEAKQISKRVSAALLAVLMVLVCCRRRYWLWTDQRQGTPGGL